MIINHKYKFIFLKTHKTASTSIEIALSKFCDGNDIITPIAREDEQIRKELGIRGPQNYNIHFKYYKKKDWVRLFTKQERLQFYNHATAQFIKNKIPEHIWHNYFKFTFERNPFDKAISRYFWSTSEPRPDISEYLNSVRTIKLSNWDIYTINDTLAVNFIGFYENLNDDLAKIVNKLNLPEELNLPKAKGNYRKRHAHYSQQLNSEARKRIEIVCAKEIAAFGYQWTCK